MKAIGLFALLALLGTMTGCALTSKAERESLFNPPGIHPPAVVTSDASIPGQIPIAQYHVALNSARQNEKDAAAISAMVDKGIGLTSHYCLGWFQRLDDVQRKLDLQEKDFNVIRDLGTALLGIGKAIPIWVAGYGAVNTAYSGIVANFNEGVLAGPTTAKIKAQVLDMLQQSADALRRDASGLTFSQAYSRIELHADTCTYSTVRNMLDSTLASTKSKRDPETGKITSERVEASYQFDDASAKLHAFWQPKGVLSPANQATLMAWMKLNDLEPIGLTVFIRGQAFGSARTKAVKDLNL